MSLGTIALLVPMAVILAAVMIAYNFFFRLYFRTQMAGAPIALVRIMGMTLRGVDARAIVDAHVCAAKAGVETNVDGLIAHERSGGNARRVVATLIEAKEHGGTVTFEDACAQDLTDHGVIEFSQAPKRRFGGQAR